MRERGLPAECVFTFPRMSAVFWTDIARRVQEQCLFHVGKSCPFSQEASVFLGDAPKLPPHSMTREEHPRRHRHQRTLEDVKQRLLYSFKGSCFEGDLEPTLARGPQPRTDRSVGCNQTFSSVRPYSWGLC